MSSVAELIKSKLLEFDPTLDVTDGSPIITLVVDPVAQALSADALTTDASTFIEAKLREAFPEITFSAGDALTDILVNAPSVLLDPYRAEIGRIERSLSLKDPTLLTNDDVDAIAANWLASRNYGARARGVVTLTLSRPTRVPINSTVTFVTASGLVFVPEVSYTFTADEVLSLENAAGEFPLPISVIADANGAEYNIGVGKIVTANNVPAFVSATNDAAFRGGVDQETNEEFALRLASIANERSLVSDAGIKAKVLGGELGAVISSVVVAGFNDVEQTRDALDVTSTGVLRGVGFAVPLGRICAVLLYSGAPVAGDLVRLTPIGEETVTEVNVISVAGPQATSYLPNTRLYVVEGDFSALVTRAYSASVTSTPQATIDGEIVTPEVHLGGKADVYILPTNDVEAVFEGEGEPVEPLNGYSGIGVEFMGLNEIRLLEAPTGAGRFIYIERGGSAGAYAIIKRDGLRLWVDKNFDAVLEEQAPYRLMDRLNLPTSAPSRVVLPRPNTPELSVTLMASRNTIDTDDVSGVVQAGDTIEIPELNVSFPITNVSGSVITVDATPTSTGQFNARILRSRTAMLPCIAHVDQVVTNNVKIPYGPCLGGEVLTATDPVLVFDGQMGRVLPHYDSLDVFSRALSEDVDEYNYRLVQNVGDQQFSDGTGIPYMGDVLLRYDWGDDLTPTGEVALPGDLFVPGPYTVVSIWGDLDIEGFIDRAETDTVVSARNAYVTARMQQPALLNPEDVVIVGDEELVVDRVYPIEMRLEAPTGRTRTREVSLRLTLVRLRTHASPPMASAYEESFEFVDAGPNISALDLLRMLASPERLLPLGLGLELAGQARAALAGENLTLTQDIDGISVQDTALDVKVCAGWVPARGVARLYYQDNRRVHLTPLWWPLYSTEEEYRYRDAQVNGRVQPRPTRINDLLVRSQPAPLIGEVDPSTWARDAAFYIAQVANENTLWAPSIGTPVSHDDWDAIDVVTDVPVYALLDVTRGDEIHVLQESVTFESRPPNIEIYYLKVTEGGGDITANGLLTNNVFLNHIANADGDALPAETPILTNAYGQTPTEFLSNQNPLSFYTIAPNVNVDTLPRSHVFYTLTPHQERYGLPAYHVIGGTGQLEFARMYERQSIEIPQGVVGDYVWIDSSSSQKDTANKVVGRTQTSITIDRILNSSTAPVQVRGWGALRLQEDTVTLLVEGPRILKADGSLTAVVEQDNYSGVGTGGTTRFLTTADIGKSITLFNAVYNPRRTVNAPPDAEVVRAHLGTFKIEAVTISAELDPHTNSLRTYAQQIELNNLAGEVLDLATQDGETALPVFFHVADEVITEDLKTAVLAPVYHREPFVYKVAGISPMLEDGQRIYVATTDDERASELAQGVGYGVFGAGAHTNGVFNSALVWRNPYTIMRQSAVSVQTEESVGALWHADVKYSASSARSVAVGEMNLVTQAGELDGYELIPGPNAYSVDEHPELVVPAVLYDGSTRIDVSQQPMTVDYTHSPAVREISSLYTRDQDRVVCSDVLFRRALPCYIGAEMTYTGGSATDIVTTDIRRLIKASVLTGRSLATSEITALAHKRRATSVLPGTSVFAVTSDRTRRRHLFFLKNTLSDMIGEHFDGTQRITGPELPVSTKLGASLDIRRR